MTALLVFGFSGWELVGYSLFAGPIALGWLWYWRDRKESIAESDRQFARSHRI